MRERGERREESTSTTWSQVLKVLEWHRSRGASDIIADGADRSG